MESPIHILLMKITSSWGNRVKSIEGKMANMSRLRREHFKSTEYSEKLATHDGKLSV